MKRFWSVLLTVAFTVLIAGGSQARASILGSAGGGFPFGEDVQVEDRDVERLLGPGGTPDPTNIVSVGDILEAVIRFDNISTDTTPVTDLDDYVGIPTYELLGYSRLLVSAIIPTADPLRFDIIFSSGFADGVTAIQLYESTTGGVYDESKAPGTQIADVTSQTLIAAAGFVDADDFWVAENAFLAITGIPANVSFPFTLGLSILPVTDPDLLVQQDGTSTINPLTGAPVVVDVSGTGSVKTRAPGVHAGWDASSDAVFQYHTVPEPASLALWGLMGAAGIGASIARRRKA